MITTFHPFSLHLFCNILLRLTVCILFLELIFQCHGDLVIQDSTIDSGLNSAEGRLIAFGDLNSDSRTDFIFVSGSLIRVVLPDEKGRFSVGESFTTDLVKVDPNAVEIVNVICADFNYDGYLDLAVMYKRLNEHPIYLWIFIGDSKTLTSEGMVGNGFFDQLAVVDVNGDMIPDFLGEHNHTKLNSKTKRDYDNANNVYYNIFEKRDIINTNPSLEKVSKVVNDDDESVQATTTNTTSHAPTEAETGAGEGAGEGEITTLRGYWIRENKEYKFHPQESEDRFTSPHSNAFVDINGDCLADMVITSKNKETGKIQIEIWLNGLGEFVQNKKENIFISDEILKSITVLSYGDMDGDGDVDLIAPFCVISDDLLSCKESGIYIFKNTNEQQLDTKNACSARNFSFTEEDMIVVNFSDTNSLVFRPSALESPPSINLGDYDRDGFLDMITVMEDSRGVRQLALFHNELCSKDKCSGPMKFVNNEILEDVSNPLFPAFVDLNEDGHLDIITVSGVQEQNKAIVYDTRALKLNCKTDSFSVKIVVLNGKCLSWCSEGDKFPSPEPVGAVAFGAVSLIFFDDILGERQFRTGHYMSRSCYNSFSTPYVVLGLGRTSNYIDTMTIAVPYTVNKKLNSHEFKSIIPNSQLLIVPHKPDDPGSWTMKLYLLPNNIILWVGVTAIVACVILSLTVLILHLKEKYEDELEKRRTQHLFNYRAM